MSDCMETRIQLTRRLVRTPVWTEPNTDDRRYYIQQEMMKIKQNCEGHVINNITVN